ncbi:metallophosphoesterase family protein [Streptosporangium sp. NPDC087985]|uniref:metallophosphoesterase family protein n=1 Tax=Streptosporangium sp. NPDC087985 TaxID=3366196 RepID=UPI00382BA671
MDDVGQAAERGREVSSRVSEEGAGWSCVQVGSFKDLRPNEETFTWFSPRTLWRSRNEVLAGLFGDPSGQVRARWVAYQRDRGVDPSFRIPLDVGPEFSFLVLGDTGEGDASQYAVVPGLLRLGADTAFAVIASDVIYPTGSGNEYDDKFFRPYQDYRAPIYAVPGNHDWYDGLGGFMRVFCDAPALEAEREGFELSPAGLRGLLWRKPEKIDETRLARARERRALPGQQAVQPAPYWAMEAPGLLIVGVDTGIDGTLDREQAGWLREVSRDPRPKVLITGKPVYTRNDYKPSALEGGGTIDDVVTDPAHNYVAAIGGDVHNYQRFPIKVGDRTIQYIVAGGSGAFMHATHTTPRVTVGGLHEDDYRCYPLRGDSLSFYSKLYSDRLRMRWLYLTPEEGVALMSERIGNAPPRDIPPVSITRRMRWAARILGGWPMPLRLPVGRIFHRYLSELSDWDTPPFFKSFLHISVTPRTLRIRCFAATGCLPQEIEPPLEDEVVIPLV